MSVFAVCLYRESYEVDYSPCDKGGTPRGDQAELLVIALFTYDQSSTTYIKMDCEDDNCCDQPFAYYSTCKTTLDSLNNDSRCQSTN